MTSRDATWTQVRALLPIDVDRDRLNGNLVDIADTRHMTVAHVYGLACDSLAMGIEAKQLVTFLMVHIELVRLALDSEDSPQLP